MIDQRDIYGCTYNDNQGNGFWMLYFRSPDGPLISAVVVPWQKKRYKVYLTRKDDLNKEHFAPHLLVGADYEPDLRTYIQAHMGPHGTGK